MEKYNKLYQNNHSNIISNTKHANVDNTLDFIKDDLYFVDNSNVWLGLSINNIVTSGIDFILPSDICNNLIMSFQNGNSMIGYHYIDNSNNGAFMSGGKNQQLLLYTRDTINNTHDVSNYLRGLTLDKNNKIYIKQIPDIYNQNYELIVGGNLHTENLFINGNFIMNLIKCNNTITRKTYFNFGDKNTNFITNDLGNVIDVNNLYLDNSNNYGNLWVMDNAYFYSNVDISEALSIGTSLPSNTIALTISGNTIVQDLSSQNIQTNNLIFENTNYKLGEINFYKDINNNKFKAASIICNGSNYNGHSTGEIDIYLTNDTGINSRVFHIDASDNKLSIGNSAGQTK